MQVRRGGIHARPIEPQVRVRGGGVVPEAVAGGSLGALEALLVVHAAEVVAVDRSCHVRGLLGAFMWKRADDRGGVGLVLVMGLRVDGVHHSPREIPKEKLKRFGVDSLDDARAAATSVRKSETGFSSFKKGGKPGERPREDCGELPVTPDNQ